VVKLVNNFKGVVLWDIDGTLISPIRHNFESLHVKAVVKNGIIPAEKPPKLLGLTDFEVISDLVNVHPNQEKGDVLENCFKDLDRISLSMYNQNSFSLCKGLPEALIKIQELGWNNGILTGNTKARMLKKLEILDITNFFNPKFMFYCELQDNRENIAARAKKILEFEKVSSSFIIGDTPRDIKVAKEYDFKVVAVGTGNFSLKYLEQFAPNLVIENLEDDLNVFLSFLNGLSLHN
jgi:phosphoglycolate phosphatase-like HAD superfamily hydrolase